MRKLVDGINRFQRERFTEDQAFFEQLANGQSPEVLFITCSDSRIDPNLLTQTGPGELFILRTAGNIVPPHGAVAGGEAATIEYAVNVLKVPDIIVCGHSHCGAMGGLLTIDQLGSLPSVRAYLEYAEATRRIVMENYADAADEDRLSLAVSENVLVQLENLQTHPSVAAALGRNELRLHGWVYKFETGEVFAYRPHEGKFLPLQTDGAPAVERQRKLSSI